MRVLKYLAVIGICLVVVGLAAAYFSLNALVKKGIETAGPMVTKTDVRVSGVSLLPFAGSGSIHGFELGNPKGFRNENAIRVGKVFVSVEPKSLLTNVMVVRSVEVASPEIWVEGSPSDNNLTRIQKNVEAFVPPSKPAVGPPTPAKKVIIDDFKVTGAKLHLSMKLLPDTTIPMPDIHLTGIGRKTNGASIKEAATEMFGSINSSITGAATGALKDLTKNVTDMGKNLGKTGLDLGKSLGGLFGKKK
jgi:hypothetical protein